MASRPVFTPYPVLTNAAMATNQTSLVTVITNLSMVSYAITWAGSSPVGSISVQVSNDYSRNADGSVRNAGTWNTLPLSAATAVTGNTGSGFIDIDAQAGYALRLIYTAGTGTGTINAIVNGKVA